MNRFIIGIMVLTILLMPNFIAKADIPGSNEPSVIGKVKNLPLNIITGKITVYYTNGYKDRALMLGQMLEEAKEFFEKSLGVTANVSLAVLDKSQWPQVDEKIPYGLPWMSPKDNLIFMPATNDEGVLLDGSLARADKIPPPVLEKLKSHNFTYIEAVQKAIDSISFHELGHIYIHAYGLKTHKYWFDELAATYFQYFYLYNKNPDWIDIWQSIGQITAKVETPKHTSLDDFERLYYDMDPDNYGWYQCMFEKRISEMYSKHGLSFLEKAKVALDWDENEITTNEKLLTSLEEIAPGFIEWSKNLGQKNQE